MNIPEQMKIQPNTAVVFTKHFNFNGTPVNAIMQNDDGTMIFFDTDYYHMSGTIQVAYVEGNS